MHTLTVNFKDNTTQIYEIEDMNNIHMDQGFLRISVPHDKYKFPLTLTYWFINVDSILQFSVE